MGSRQQDVVLCVEAAVIIREPKLKVDLTRYIDEHTFQFDDAYEDHTSNSQLYQSCVQPLVDAFVQGRAKCTCFAYGQTGSGKTYVSRIIGELLNIRFTMLGDNSGENPIPGIFPLAMDDLFSKVRELPDYESMSVVVSFYEIYCGKLYDLLNNRKHLHARENAQGNVVIQNIREIEASSSQDLMSQIQVGLNSRTTGVTGANVDSSRSHAIIQISLKRVGPTGKLVSTGGKLSFIDLAGSERGADTVDQDKQTRIDGAEINKSLLALKECIRALDQQLDHTPFRGSKLTQVLKDSFVGQNCMTLMIANISPSSGSVEHTLNTLRYAYRVKELRGASTVHSRRIPVTDDDQGTLRPPRTHSRFVRPTEASSGDSAAGFSSASSSVLLDDTPIPRTSVPAPLVESSDDIQGISLSPVGGKPGADLESLAKQHDRLIGTILSEEEELILTHRKSLEVFVQMLNEEMSQVNLIDQPGSDVDVYVAYMDENLRQKEEMISSMRSKLDNFKNHLLEEEKLSRIFDSRIGG